MNAQISQDSFGPKPQDLSGEIIPFSSRSQPATTKYKQSSSVGVASITTNNGYKTLRLFSGRATPTASTISAPSKSTLSGENRSLSGVLSSRSWQKKITKAQKCFLCDLENLSNYRCRLFESQTKKVKEVYSELSNKTRALSSFCRFYNPEQ